MNETMIYELRNLMKNAKAALEIAHYMGELPIFVDELKDKKDPLVFALEHEQYVTSLINDIYEAAYNVKDFRTMQFLDWFVKEQGEEEKNAEDMIKKMDLFGDDAKSLYMLNSEMLGRVYTAPSLVLD